MSDDRKVVFACFKGRSIFSKAIKFYTRSEYSHIGYMVDDKTIIEAWPTTSILDIKWTISSAFINHKPNTPVELWSLLVSENEYTVITSFFENLIQTKAPYDYLAVFGFLLKYKVEESKAYFCSEGCISPLVKVRNWTKINPAFVSPADFVKLIQAAGGRLEKSLYT